MNRLWQQLAIATNWPVLLAVVVLGGVGVVSIWSAWPDDAKKQLAFMGAGIACMLVVQALNYQRLANWAWPFYLLSLALVLYTIAPGVPRSGFLGVPDDRGQRNWINFRYLSLQPSELLKVAFVVVLARYLRFRSNYRTLGGLLLPFALAVVPLMFIMMQPDLGTALVFFPALFAMLFVAGAKIRHLLAIIGMGVALAPLAWMCGDVSRGGPGLPVLKHLPTLVKPYQRARVYALFSDDPTVLRETGYQQEHALIAFGSGGAAGKGAMKVPIGQHVPEGHNDMIFALIGEQFGFLGSLLVLGTYLVLFAAGIEISSATREPFGRLVAVGIVSLLAGQTFLNLLVCVRLMPVTGVTLPFVSYGGSSLLSSFIAAGLLLNIGQNRPVVIARSSFEFE